MLTRGDIKKELKERIDKARMQIDEPHLPSLERMQLAMRVSVLSDFLVFIIDDELADAQAHFKEVESIINRRPE